MPNFLICIAKTVWVEINKLKRIKQVCFYATNSLCHSCHISRRIFSPWWCLSDQHSLAFVFAAVWCLFCRLVCVRVGNAHIIYNLLKASLCLCMLRTCWPWIRKSCRSSAWCRRRWPRRRSSSGSETPAKTARWDFNRMNGGRPESRVKGRPLAEFHHDGSIFVLRACFGCDRRTNNRLNGSAIFIENYFWTVEIGIECVFLSLTVAGQNKRAYYSSTDQDLWQQCFSLLPKIDENSKNTNFWLFLAHFLNCGIFLLIEIK